MNGYGQGEAAKALGIRPGTVKSRLHRALAKLAVLNAGTESVDQVHAAFVEARML
ncbi:RNA polymerase sigma factor [Sinomonas humi]|uniref:RNA polymerase sigma factor n=1 Tax=Sinomonas humi TaxID=1338436 RepID=UPI0009DC9A9D|nr:sigma factor-like helix-turn-helix DNA-binding protein [Sinomonas humi]